MLNFPDAMRLAEIVSKYIDTESIKSEALVMEFLDRLLDKISPEDYVKIIKLLFGEILNQKLDAKVLVLSILESMKINNMQKLLETYAKMVKIHG